MRNFAAYLRQVVTMLAGEIGARTYRNNMMQLWSNYLDVPRAGAKILPFAVKAG